MKKMKRILATTLTLSLLVGSLVGCGGSDSKKGGAKLTGEKITITAQVSGHKEAWLEHAAEAFTHETGIEVEFTFDALLSQNLTTILETDGVEKSDIYNVGTYEWAKWLETGLIEDLTDFMNEPDEAEGGKSLNDRTTKGMEYIFDKQGNKKQGTVPLVQPVYGMAYNKTMMKYICQDVLGWEADHIYPVNTKELQEVIDALNKEVKAGSNKELLTYSQDGKTFDVKPWTWSGSTGMLEFLFYSWFGQYVGQEQLSAYLAEQGDEPTLYKDPAFYLLYQKICDLLDITTSDSGEVYSANSIPNCVSFNHTASQSQFILGKSLLIPTASWFYTEMSEAIMDEKQWGFMPVPWLSDDAGEPLTAEGVEMPKNEDGTYRPYTYTPATSGFLVIPSESKNKENAKKFLRFLTSSEYLPKISEDIQETMAYEIDYSKIKKTEWFAQAIDVKEKCEIASYFSDNRLVLFGRFGFYQNPGVAPYSQLSIGTFGSVEKMVDSATGKELKAGEKAKGFAVSENVYNYVEGNAARALVGWNESKQMVGID